MYTLLCFSTSLTQHVRIGLTAPTFLKKVPFLYYSYQVYTQHKQNIERM